VVEGAVLWWIYRCTFRFSIYSFVAIYSVVTWNPEYFEFGVQFWVLMRDVVYLIYDRFDD